jgi:hypothetical protein
MQKILFRKIRFSRLNLRESIQYIAGAGGATKALLPRILLIA